MGSSATTHASRWFESSMGTIYYFHFGDCTDEHETKYEASPVMDW